MILQKMEEMYGPLHKHFNLICGTSTGGIIALALASGIPISKVVEFYKDSGPKIFPYEKGWKRAIHFLKQLGWKSKYSDAQLREALEGVFDNNRIEDCKTHVLIPTVNITTGEPCIFKSDHVPQLTRDKKRLLTEVALATSAAPTYFPIVELQMQNRREQFVDGGLVANNPALYGIQEYLRYYKNDSRYDDYSLLSISSLNEAVKFPDLIKNKRRSFIKWSDKLISLMIDSQSAAVHHHIEHLRSHFGGSYVRIPSMDLTADEKKKIALDMASHKSLSILIEKGIQASEQWINKEDVKAFFTTISKEEPA